MIEAATPTNLATSSEQPSRRDVLLTAATIAGASAVASGASAASDAAAFGAPLVEIYVPPGILTSEQKGAMIKGLTEVVLDALALPPDPSRRMFVEIIETAEGGYGVNGQVFVPAHK